MSSVMKYLRESTCEGKATDLSHMCWQPAEAHSAAAHAAAHSPGKHAGGGINGGDEDAAGDEEGGGGHCVRQYLHYSTWLD